jgi:hypothetical protein
VQASSQSTVVITNDNDIYYWGNSLFEKRCIFKPKEFKYKNLMGIKIEEIYLSNKHILYFEKINFKSVSLKVSYGFSMNQVEISGSCLGNYSSNMLAKL